MNASFFQDDACSTASDNAGTRSSRLQEHATSTINTEYLVHDCRTSKCHVKYVALCFFCALLDSQWNFFGLAVAQTNTACAVTNHNECGERKATTALDHFGHAIDVYHA